MVEDEDGKIRRNLVAVSAVILLLAWLDVPIAAVAARLLGERPDSPSIVLPPWKVWLAAAALLGYCVVRYGYSDEAAKGSKALNQRVQGLSDAKLQKHYRRLGYQIERRSLPAGPMRDKIDSAIAEAASGRGRSDKYEGVELKALVELETPWSPGGPGREKLDIKLAFGGEDVHGPTAIKIKLTYSVPSPRAWFWSVAARVEASIFSKGAVAHAWPIGLAIAAAAVLVWKLGRALWSI